jgi:hypothetical protein
MLELILNTISGSSTYPVRLLFGSGFLAGANLSQTSIEEDYDMLAVLSLRRGCNFSATASSYLRFLIIGILLALFKGY